MFEINDTLKDYAMKKLGVQKGASEEVYRKAINVAISKGTLSASEVLKMSKGEGKKKPEAAKSAEGMVSISEVQKMISDAISNADTGSAKSVFMKAARIDVKRVEDMYRTTKSVAICPQRTGIAGNKGAHPNAGKPAEYEGKTLEMPSELDKAVVGAFFKFSLASERDLPRCLRMTDHDRDLMNYALHEQKWSGLISPNSQRDDGETRLKSQKLTEMQIKAILDDNTSGGLEAAPIVFDDAVILTPVLYGELFPLVNTVNISRGRRIEGFSIGNPTFTSNVAEGTAITPFTTDAFIAAFDTTIFPAVAAMEIGMDFEQDAPNDIGSLVIQQYGLKSMEWLDRVIAVGDGTNEPTGITVASGITSIASDSGVSGPPTISDYEGLMFGVTKKFRSEPGATPVFIGNETSYRRSRGIPVGPTDERRVFGMTHSDYELFGQPYKIQDDIANTKIAYGNMKRYRMYRRLGLNIRTETAGNYLALRNLRLFVLRMRFGGQPELGGAFSIMTDSQN